MNNGIIGFPFPHPYESEEQTLAASTLFTFNLPSARRPDLYRAVFVNKTAEFGYVPGDEVACESSFKTDSSFNLTIISNPGVVQVGTGTATTFNAANKTSPGTNAACTHANWKLKIYAYWGLP